MKTGTKFFVSFTLFLLLVLLGLLLLEFNVAHLGRVVGKVVLFIMVVAIIGYVLLKDGKSKGR